MKVSTVSLFVEDQDRALAFYTEKLGMELRRDAPFGEGERWLAVAPEGSDTEVVLYKPQSGWEHYAGVVGKAQAITFEVEDLAAAVAELKEKGVRVIAEPTTQEWGTFAMILDSEDNQLVLVQM